MDRKSGRGGRRPCRSRKRTFSGNQHKTGDEAEDQEGQEQQQDDPEGQPPRPSSSQRKLRSSEEFIPPIKRDFGYFLIEFFTVFSLLSTLVKCKQCSSDVTFEPSNIRGLGFKIKLDCSGSCPPRYITSCPYLKNGFEVNSRIVFAFRLLGIAHSGIAFFCGLMDLPPPVDKNWYLTVSRSLLSVIQNVAERCMMKAAEEEKSETVWKKVFQNPQYVSISNDGSWMKRGFTSLFGIVAVIGQLSGKVIDIIIKSAYCKVCEAMEKKEGTAEYEEYVNEHWFECAANHEGSSGKMEVTGTVQMFERSVETRGVYYKNFIGDGDSKTHKAVVEANPYGDDCPVVKKECVGRVHKRMGTRLRNCVKNTKGLNGAGKLTGKEIDKLSDYYGRAIRNDPDDPQKMHDAIWATFYHRFSTDRKPMHHLCPPGEDSWCGYQKAIAKNETFKHTPKFRPPDAAKKIEQAIKPIYTDLTKRELLERCTGAHTQNNNESFNSLVWNIAPKTKFSGNVHVETAAYLAVCNFNEGCNTILAVLKEAGITVGQRCADECGKRDEKRIASATRKTAAATKEARIALRQARIDAQDKQVAEEGQMYGPGIDDS
ncbi:hypothetical protein FOCC_FOCC012693 [Frankliniella occidentalis]|nr:hypothetical protein FOCC_FOCC012693 [Frankliniella occidentalis]